MSKAGDQFENPITGEFGYTRIGTEETNGDYVMSDLAIAIFFRHQLNES